VSSYAEIKHLKEEIAKKGSLLVKLKEDKMKRPGGPGAAKDRSPGPGVKSASSDREKEELRKTIKKLEGRLSSMNAAEKPLEEHQTEQQAQHMHQNNKLLASAAEFATKTRFRYQEPKPRSSFSIRAETSFFSETETFFVIFKFSHLFLLLGGYKFLKT
jgi:hypothetical protein